MYIYIYIRISYEQFSMNICIYIYIAWTHFSNVNRNVHICIICKLRVHYTIVSIHIEISVDMCIVLWNRLIPPLVHWRSSTGARESFSTADILSFVTRSKAMSGKIFTGCDGFSNRRIAYAQTCHWL